MSGLTAEQSGLSTYAEAVLRHNGIKSCRARWPSPDVLTLEVDPTRLAKARSLLPTIQQRAGKNTTVEMHQPTAQDDDAAPAAEPS